MIPGGIFQEMMDDVLRVMEVDKWMELVVSE